MADTVKLASLRVTAGMEAASYVKGAAAVASANEEMAASAKNAGSSITSTQRKVNAAGDLWTRLSRQYVEGAAQSQKFDKALRDLQRGFDTGNVSGAQAELVLEGLYRKYGLMADAEKLAANGQEQLAAAARNVNASLESSSKVVATTTASLEHQAKSLSLNRMQMMELTHVGREMFTMLATGVSPMRAVTMESGRIMTLFSLGEGGIAGTLAALAPIMLPLIAIFGGLAVAFGAFTSALDKGRTKAIGFVQAIKGTFVTLWQAFTSQFKDAPAWFKNIWGELGDIVGIGINGMIQDVAILGATIDEFLKTLPDRFKVYWSDGVNFALRMLNNLTDAANNAAVAMGLEKPLTPEQTRESHVGYTYIDPAIRARVEGSNAELATRVSAIRSTNYLDQIYKNGLSGGKSGSGKRDPWASLMTSAANDTRTLQAQAAALGQSTQQTGYLEEKQKLLNRAYQDNIKLSPDQVAAIDAQARAYGNAKAQLETLTDLYNTGKQASEDFFSTIKQDLMSGTSLWGAFGDAASKVLDDIANKALQMAADGIWDDIWGGATKGASGGSGGFFSSVASFFGTLLGHNATGTDFWRGGMTWVGERGPELINLPRGAQVLSNPASMAAMGGANQNSVSIRFAPSYRIDGSGLSAKELSAVMASNNQQVLDLLNRQIVPVVHDALGIKMAAGTRVRNAYFTAA